MSNVSFTGLMLVAAVAFGAPLLLGLVPRLRLPAVVLEIVAGIVIGPSVLGWVRVDLPIQILAILGLDVLLFLAGLEIDPSRLRGKFLGISLIGFAVSFGLALALSLGLGAAGIVGHPLLVAITLSATSLGLVIPVLKDSGEGSSALGQLTIAASSVADFGAVILLSLFFSKEAAGTGAKLVLLGGFVVLAGAAGFAVARAGRSMRLSAALLRLQDTTAEIRVRGAVLLLVAFLALAQRLGIEVILAAFIAGAVLKLVDKDVMTTHPKFPVKLEAIGYGFLIPIFFVTSGIQFDLHALVASPGTIARVPIFLVALLVTRGAPALLYRSTIGGRRSAAAACLQATSLPFIVTATRIGMDLGAISHQNGAALVAAGLLSVLIFPVTALNLIRKGDAPQAPQVSDSQSNVSRGGPPRRRP
jgi:Kef-type K+ transport system membrane component KefB